jgi:hypothetical protein
VEYLKEAQAMCQIEAGMKNQLYNQIAMKKTSDVGDGESIWEIAESELIQFFLLTEGGSGVVRCLSRRRKASKLRRFN